MLKRYAIVASFPAFMLAARFIPFDRLPSTCAFYRISGYPCPTCGMTRSVMAIAHLNFERAVMFNPLGPVLLLICTVWWVIAMRREFTGRESIIATWVSRQIDMLAVFGLFALFIFGAWRIAHLTGW